MKQKLPFLLTLTSMFAGVLISIFFAVNEDIFKNKINDGLAKNTKIQSIMDPAEKSSKIKAEAEKNWRYYQRFHFHSTGISSMTLGVLVLLIFINAPTLLTTICSFMVSIGGLLYPFVWLFAGIYGPEMGREEAKEAFAIFGYMGGIYLLGIMLAIFLLIKFPFNFSKKT